MISDDLLQRGAALLAEAGISDPQREARLLWRNGGETGDFLAMVARRAQRVPMSQILGYRDFYAHRFIVTEAVLDPRPDTETLITCALETAFTRVLDLGTGSGCILLSLLAARVDAQGVGADLSDAALEVAQQNCAALEIGARADFMQSDWFAQISGTFDLIVSNPPYIARSEMEGLQPEVRLYEPRMALTDEADGLSAYRIICGGAPAHLAPGGRLIVEIGPTQANAVAAMIVDTGLIDVQVHQDFDGRDRVVAAQMPN
ncbi:peptide chain release factor N(5)-glutamine methyltransferase [Loktanella sp. D2R18]|uniref:peptide chain release factor N(5)-glutamine methyltransferase n=1 Tax=Rhodobacterales TaxID=204455 RepID=UPI000DE82FEC|nr:MULTISPECIES: peptide chain release factor N(5)-glutamine methyltransferase [Rhodobacterales]MDO6589630.1 peptide chain release factor N(5)-glutamine methyltransferase [Yoonia sp. 1_MG-2023]RBW44265.1 peptide chain release factor N(5)-glutamine methyltransferase [Loktanella sp. D2R18]